jgi:hypothetical protein
MYPLRIGPVLFETREQWRVRSFNAGRLSKVTGRRLERLWTGRRVRKRARSFEEYAEQSILDAIGECPIVCTVETNGLSSKMMGEKAALAARLAMTALSLLWGHPSEGLKWMSLKFDGQPYHRAYAVFSESRYAGGLSSMSQLGSGRWTDQDLITQVAVYRPLFDVLAESITRFVQPGASTDRPRLNDAIFLSLWWLQAACREEADQIATAKFVSSMDALVKGQDAHAIMKFLKARGNYDSHSSLMTDGRTTKSVITELYSVRRSQLLHGSSVDFAQDWSSARSTAEAVARLCLVLASEWMENHPHVDELEAFSR